LVHFSIAARVKRQAYFEYLDVWSVAELLCLLMREWRRVSNICVLLKLSTKVALGILASSLVFVVIVAALARAVTIIVVIVVFAFVA